MKITDIMLFGNAVAGDSGNSFTYNNESYGVKAVFFPPAASDALTLAAEGFRITQLSKTITPNEMIGGTTAFISMPSAGTAGFFAFVGSLLDETLMVEGGENPILCMVMDETGDSPVMLCISQEALDIFAEAGEAFPITEPGLYILEELAANTTIVLTTING